VKEFFRLNRFVKVIKNDFTLNIKSIKYYFILVIGIFLMLLVVQFLSLNSFFLIFSRSTFNIIKIFFSDINNFQQLIFVILLNAGGIILGVQSFKIIHYKEKSSLWLCIPASLFEKYLSKIILIGPIFAFILYIVFSFVTALVNGTYFIITGKEIQLLPLFSELIIKEIFSLFALQNLFITGSIFIKRNNFLKTAGIYLIILISFTLIYICYALLAWYNYSGNILKLNQLFAILSRTQSASVILDYLSPRLNKLINILNIIQYIILFPLCWVLSFLKLRKIES